MVEDYETIFGLATAFAFGSTAHNVYRSTMIPITRKDTDGCASEYESEGDYIAIAGSTRRIALPS